MKIFPALILRHFQLCKTFQILGVEYESVSYSTWKRLKGGAGSSAKVSRHFSCLYGKSKNTKLNETYGENTVKCYNILNDSPQVIEGYRIIPRQRFVSLDKTLAGLDCFLLRSRRYHLHIWRRFFSLRSRRSRLHIFVGFLSERSGRSRRSYLHTFFHRSRRSRRSHKMVFFVAITSIP